MADWNIEFVEPPKSFVNTSTRAIALDSNGFPHTAYSGDNLYYAFYDGISWNCETVDQITIPGECSSIALDP